MQEEIALKGAADDIAAAEPDLAEIEQVVSRAKDALLAVQRQDGHFIFELEADVSIPSEYILFKHFLGEPAEAELEAKFAVYLRRHQAAHDGWALFTDGDYNISSSVKAYFALKAMGDSPEADHMRRARGHPAHGGAANTNVFTRSSGSRPGFRWTPVLPPYAVVNPISAILYK